MPEFTIHSKDGNKMGWPQLEMARGQFPHAESLHKFGASSGLTTDYAPVAISEIYRTPQSSGASLEVVSSSTNDSTSGTGAHSLHVIGTSTDWYEINETVTLNGTTPVSLSNKFTRVYRTYVASSGTYANSTAASHTGALDVQEAGSGPLWARINNNVIARGQSQIGVYTVPKGKTAYIMPHYVSVDSNKTADFGLFHRLNADESSAPYTAMRMIAEYTGITGYARLHDPGAPEGPYAGPCDIGYMAKAAATAEVAVEFEILLVDNGE